MANPKMYQWRGNGGFVFSIDYFVDIHMFGSTDEAIDVVLKNFRAHFKVCVDDSLTQF